MAAARRRTAPPPRGRFGRLVLWMAANPVAAGGGLLMAATAGTIMANALALQPGPHPAPLFLGTRPVAPADMPAFAAAETASDADSLDALVERTTGRSQRAIDHGLVADVQRALKARGYYAGEVDGLTGPMTSAAIVEFERDQGLEPTGEPTGDVLSTLMAAGDAAAAPVAPTPDPAPEAPAAAVAPAAPPAAVPAPRARPMAAEADGPLPVRQAVVRSSDPAAGRPTPAAYDPRLAKVQESLDLLGYGPLSADGRWSGDTRAAIRRFEENRGLPPTGAINEAFLAELVRIGGLALD
jgi:peptidoglycan hydrolase-like protein with peptidoglycan-binding domain